MSTTPEPTGSTASAAALEAARRSLLNMRNGDDYHRQFLDKWLPETGAFVDAGCGTGRIASHYHRPERPAIGIDVDADAIRAARAFSDATFVVGSAFELPIESGALSAYVGLGIIELDETPGCRRALGEANRVLRDRGLIYLTVPYRNLRRRSGRASYRGQAIPSFSADEMTQMLSATGFETLLTRPSSIAWGARPLGMVAPLARDLLVREREDAWSYRLLGPLLRPLANSLLVIGRKVRAAV